MILLCLVLFAFFAYIGFVLYMGVTAIWIGVKTLPRAPRQEPLPEPTNTLLIPLNAEDDAGKSREQYRG